MVNSIILFLQNLLEHESVMKVFAKIFSLLFALAMAGKNVFADSDSSISAGVGEYNFFDDINQKTITVFYYKPSNYSPDSRILFVLHGDTRTAFAHRLEWKASAEKYEFMLLVPCFSEEDFPGSNSFQFGNVVADKPDSAGFYTPVPERLRTFSILERLFADFRTRERTNRTKYLIYGHSAGAQFVHRMLLFAPDANIEYAVSANAGWYILPDYDLAWPFGLKGIETVVDEEQIRHYLEMPLLLALGDQDLYNTNRLNTSPPAMKQGENRYARGYFYFNYCKTLAVKLGVSFGWTLLSVPGIGHSNAGMAEPVAAWLSRE